MLSEELYIQRLCTAVSCKRVWIAAAYLIVQSEWFLFLHAVRAPHFN